MTTMWQRFCSMDNDSNIALFTTGVFGQKVLLSRLAISATKK